MGEVVRWISRARMWVSPLFRLRSSVRVDELSTVLSEASTKVGAWVDEASGYRAISRWKQEVEDAAARFDHARDRVRMARHGFEDAVSRRAAAQSEVNAMLQRKDRWTDGDLSRFSELCREEHSLSSVEKEAQQEVRDSETYSEHALQKFMEALRTRFQEEALWSEKVRAASTFGTWTLIAVNTSLFALSVLYVEPRKRRALHRQVLEDFEIKRQADSANLDEKLKHFEADMASVVAEKTVDVLLSELRQPDDGPVLESPHAVREDPLILALYGVCVGVALASVMNFLLR
mmetsp:Transcript_10039/g.20334  ORF Transcript_10039/g.20334 Transcript_10039/m.20334 type:complete len:290 (-) Transcript_10039:2104-2973(-)